MIASSVILDLVLIAIVALCVWLGARRGLFRSLADLAAYLVALIGASWAANQFSAQVMEHLRPVAEHQVSQSITDYLTALTEADVSYSGLLKGLLDTLTENGSVARGVCVTDENGYLKEIAERTKIVKTAEGAAYTEDDGATWTPLALDTLVSMNMWGLPAAFLKERFE